MSTATFAELAAVVRRPKLQPAFARSRVNVDNFLTSLRAEAQFINPVPTTTLIRDERDRPFLDLLATLPPPQYFVTGDQDFDATHYSGVPVISAVAFARLLSRQ